MNHPCRDFRIVLEGRLDGRAAPERLGELAFRSMIDEHLFTCAECRALLDAEEALESLLASLPEPRLAPAVRARVLARLRLAREDDRLDRLLDVASDEMAPAGLAEGVLAALAREREDLRVANSGAASSGVARSRVVANDEERLDQLLDLDVVHTPVGLAQRTLGALRVERAADALVPRADVDRRPLSVVRRRALVRVLAFSAAAAAFVAFLWFVRPERTESTRGTTEFVQEPPRPTAPGDVPSDGAGGAPNASPRLVPGGEQVVAQNAAPVSDEVLEALDVLENWDVLVAGDGETLLTSLPTADEALLAVLENEG